VQPIVSPSHPSSVPRIGPCFLQAVRMETQAFLRSFSANPHEFILRMSNTEGPGSPQTGLRLWGGGPGFPTCTRGHRQQVFVAGVRTGPCSWGWRSRF
jgi:hypothetical protein